MEMTIENRIRLKNPPDILKHLLVEQLRVVNPKFLEAQAAGRSTWGINQYITNFMVLPDDSLLVPRGLRAWIIDKGKELNIEYTLIDKRTKFDHIEIDSSRIKYRPYQFDAVLNMISDAPEGILVAPAGSGKTIMGLSTIPLLGQPTLWLTHTGPLADQVVERAKVFLPDIGEIGTIGNGKWDIGKVLTIGMIQTLVRNTEDLIKLRNTFGLVILDEAHHCPARTFLDVICHLNPYYIYGLTATPYRRDNLEQLMFQTIGLTTTTISIKKVEKYGGIIMPVVWQRDLPSQPVEGNDIQAIIKKFIVHNQKRTNIIVNDVLRESKAGHFGIVVSDRREHCEILYKQILAGWPKTGIATGKYSKKYVQEQVLAFNEGRITTLVATFALLGEGFDVPFLDRAFICMPFRAEAKVEQLIGRVQRQFPGKKDAIVYDYVDVDIGVVKNQYFNKSKSCRYRTYMRLGVVVESH
jgi:superfamily II DNA or RNA helicase